MNDMKKMGPAQLRELIAAAQARLAEVEPPSKRWEVHLIRTRKATEAYAVVVEAADSEAAVTAAWASEDCLNESSDWECCSEELLGFHVDSVAEEIDAAPDYRVDDQGTLEEVEE